MMLRRFVYSTLIFLLVGGGLFTIFQHSEALTLVEDVNNDGIVNIQDLVLIANAFGQSVDADAAQNPDVNGDGTVNVLDLVKVSSSFGKMAEESSTSTSIEHLANVMQNFREALSSQQLAQVTFSLDDREFYSWSNLPVSIEGRGGIRFGALSDEQLTHFHEVLNVFLSDQGYTKVSLITKDVEGHLSQIRPGFWDPNAYHIALFGEPADDAWGFQLDGHHLALNFLVQGDEVSIVPAFIGSEPATVDGTEVLKDERSRAFMLLQSLDAAQQNVAIQTGRRGIQVGAGRGGTDTYRNYDYSGFVDTGLKASEMSETQKENLRALIKTYVYNLETEFADVWMADVDAGFEDTYFVWMGDTTPNAAIYYRVFNPAVWIEYNNEGGVGGRGNNLDHVHTITRAPNGKDYGVFALNRGPKTLLEHYVLANHHKVNDTLFDYRITRLEYAKHTEAH